MKSHSAGHTASCDPWVTSTQCPCKDSLPERSASKTEGHTRVLHYSVHLVKQQAGFSSRMHMVWQLLPVSERTWAKDLSTA